jgi:hypothetical protein
MTIPEWFLTGTFIAAVALVALAFLAARWIDRWDRWLADRAAPNARLLIRHGEPEPPPPARHRRRRDRWSPEQYARETGLDSLRHGYPAVRPQPVPRVVPHWLDPDATTATLTVIDPQEVAR